MGGGPSPPERGQQLNRERSSSNETTNGNTQHSTTIKEIDQWQSKTKKARQRLFR
jgi:hypothetical protein